jgi:hypothetical protein
MVTRIWVEGHFVNIKPTDFINSTRRLHSFCVYNSQRHALVKAQGGWYIIKLDGTLEFFERNLNMITFESLYYALQI